MNFIKKKIRKFLFFLIYPLIIIIEIIKPIKLIKLCQIKTAFIGTYVQEVDAYFFHKIDEKQKNENYKIIFFEGKLISNSYIRNISRRFMHVKNFSRVLKFLYESLEYWKKKDHLFYLSDYWTRNLTKDKITSRNIFIPNCKKNENNKGIELLENLGIPKNAEWICISNRDSAYKKKYIPKFNLSYHDHRNFSVKSLVPAAEYFANKGYYVVRMGSIVEEKLGSENKKVIDYANSNFVNDFSDIFLLANCKAYFGSDTGINAVSDVFSKKVYFINFTSTQLFHLTTFNYGRLLTVKRIGDKTTGKLLSMKEILGSNFAYSWRYDDFQRNGAVPVSNTSEEIKNFAEEVYYNIENGKPKKEDVEIQEAFWQNYTKYVDKEKLGHHRPHLGADFLRQNIDLLG
tara:strand:+ start:266 stop:1468 length:1203 start_codon:yes stop_codon:yes gene_type:complete